MGRPRSSENLRDIAELLARDKQQSWIAEHLGVSLTAVNRRVNTLRAWRSPPITRMALYG